MCLPSSGLSPATGEPGTPPRKYLPVNTCVANSVGKVKHQPSLAEDAPEPSLQGGFKSAGLALLCGLTPPERGRRCSSHKKYTGQPLFPVLVVKSTNVGVGEGMPALEASVTENEGGSQD